MAVSEKFAVNFIWCSDIAHMPFKYFFHIFNQQYISYDNFENTRLSKDAN